MPFILNISVDWMEIKFERVFFCETHTFAKHFKQLNNTLVP